MSGSRPVVYGTETNINILDIETMNTGKSLLLFVAGAMAGAATALFLAPDSGANTRAKIRQSAADMTGKAKQKIAEGLEIIENALEEEK